MTAGSGRQPPIADYGFLSDCRAAALVSTEGSVDWFCMPRFDSGSQFGRILDWEKGGHLQIRPSSGKWHATREYVGDSLVLATTIYAETGQARIVDCLSRSTRARVGSSQLIRVVEGLEGSVELDLFVRPRFDYGSLSPWVTRRGPRTFSVIGGDDGLLVWSDVDLEASGLHELEGAIHTSEGSRARLTVEWVPPQDMAGAVDAVDGRRGESIDQAVDETERWWRRWAGRAAGAGRFEGSARRSAIVLQGLVHEPTGAVAAAATTSLPEAPGGARNWDYRLSWIRDSQFTVRSLADLGFTDEADGVHRFIERSSAGSAESLQIMYGVTGKRRLVEQELPHLEGYRGASPVRIGNGAADQDQHDVFGYVLELAWRWHRRGRSPDDDYWRFLAGVVDEAARRWAEPDPGIWEVRGDPQHFVHSKVMCWAAVDRGLRLAAECDRKAPTSRWEKVRDEIRRTVESEGYDARRGTFRRAFGRDDVDSALLLLPSFDFCAYDDERMIGTVDAVRADLDDGGQLRRYRADDGLDSEEGAFVACTFWLAECLAAQGRVAEATEAYEHASAASNDLGLFSEEYDTGRSELLGNFPQGLTHLSHIAAAIALARAEDINP